jgi:hypothetical protein
VSLSEVIIVILHPDTWLAASPADTCPARAVRLTASSVGAGRSTSSSRARNAGQQALTITRKGGKVVTGSLAPRTARAIDLATAERTDGPSFLIRTSNAQTGTARTGITKEASAMWT